MIKTSVDLVDKIEALMKVENEIPKHCFWQPSKAANDEENNGDISGYFTSERIGWREGGDDYRVVVDSSACSGNAAVHIGYFKNNERVKRRDIEDSICRMKMSFIACGWMADIPMNEIHTATVEYIKKKADSLPNTKTQK